MDKELKGMKDELERREVPGSYARVGWALMVVAAAVGVRKDQCTGREACETETRC